MAVIYQKDKNAIKFIQEFYSKLTKHKLSQYEVDSILAQYDGDYHSMVKDLYDKLSDHNLSEEELDSVVNHYGLKKRLGRFYIRFGRWYIGFIRNENRS